MSSSGKQPAEEPPAGGQRDDDIGDEPGAAPANDDQRAGLRATLLSDLDLDDIPPREWIYGRELLRGFVSVLSGTGGGGKTTYTLAVGFSVATARPLLAQRSEPASPFTAVHKAGSVWFYNLEDASVEMRRRVKAVLLDHNIDRHSMPHPVYLDSGRDRKLIITRRSGDGTIIAHPVVDDLVNELIRRNIAVLVIDPFKLSHQATENDNDEMNEVMRLWAQVADQANCAVWLVHHFRKGGQAGDSESSRDAVAIQNNCRVMSTISATSTEEAKKLGIKEEKRKQFIRKDDAKANLAPSVDRAEWYQLTSVALNNATPDYPTGDHVQSLRTWEPPSPWEGMSWATIVNILDLLEEGPSAGERYTHARQAKDRWAGNVLVQEAGKTPAEAATIVATWIETGLLEKGEYSSPAQNHHVCACLTVNRAKAAEMKANAVTAPRKTFDSSGRPTDSGGQTLGDPRVWTRGCSLGPLVEPRTLGSRGFPARKAGNPRERFPTSGHRSQHGSVTNGAPKAAGAHRPRPTCQGPG